MMDLSDEFEASSEYSHVTNTASIDAADPNNDGIDMVDDESGHDEELQRKRRNTPKRKNHWDSNWGLMLKDPELQNSWSVQAKKFRRRFRVTYPLFLYIVGICKEVNLFNIKIEKKAVPIEIKILIGLRMLARGNCADDIEEMSGVPMSTVYNIFHVFVENFSTIFLDKFVSFPKDEELIKVMALYGKLGLPGTVGSMDCTHVLWSNAAKNVINSSRGKEKKATLAFQVVWLLSFTRSFCNSWSPQ